MSHVTWLSLNQNIDKTNLSDPIFLKACFVLDTTEHIICKNGELCTLYFLQHSYEQKSVVWRKQILGPR
jgi:hypothetical protein